jgi:NAD(P)H dehydrogenase (quinone)
MEGDKLNSLISLSLFAAQHSMIWLPVGILPQYDEEGRQLDEPNGLASYLGLMTISNNSHKAFSAPHDLHTAELFGQRIGKSTIQLKSKNSIIK